MQENFAAKLPLSPNQGPDIPPDMPVPRAVRQICRAELTTLADMLPVALLGDVEGVHKVRVTIRRLRTCLRFGKPYFKKSVIRSLRADLQAIGQAFGRVRDLDVLQLGFRQFYTDEEIHPGFDQAFWIPAFGKIDARSRAAMRSCAESALFADLLGRLNDFLKPEHGLRSEAKQAGLPGSLRAYLAPILEEQLAAILEFRTSPDNPPPYEEFHHLRLLAKAHRYTLEFFQPVLSPEPAAALIDNLVGIQDHLGELNDCVVAEKLLHTALENDLPSEVRQAVSDFSAHKNAERQVLTNTFSQVWANYRTMQPQALLQAAVRP